MISLVLGALLFLVPVLPALAAVQEGKVQSGNKSLGYAYVTLYRAGISEPAEILGTALSGKNGLFQIVYDAPAGDDAVLYLIADVLDDPDQDPEESMIRLATVLGSSPGAHAVINERTTVAAAFAMAQFIDGADISGKNPGLKNAAAMSHNLVNLDNGDFGRVLKNSPNGDETTAMTEFNSLSNMIAGCIHSSDSCSTLFNLSPDFQGVPAGDTLEAMINIAHNPANNNEELFDFSQDHPFYRPSLGENEVPDAWTIALRFTDRQHKLDGPGNIAFDQYGNAWVNNNYSYSPNPAHVCGDNHMFAFRPDGSEFPGSPFGGINHDGGLFGAGYGITFDTNNNLWISNYGFTGSDCNLDNDTVKSLSESVSQFDPKGNALSPSTPPNPPPYGGWRSDSAIYKPQGMASDKDGNIWITSCGNDSLVELQNGNIGEAKSYPEPTNAFDLQKPFDVAIDTGGNVWVDSNANQRLFAIRTDGTILEVHDDSIVKPMGIATDQSGNVWIANSGIVDVPCHEGESDADRLPSDAATSDSPFPGASAGLYMQDGTIHFFTGGGIFLPWGIAVDGNNNVWIANFGGPSSGLVGVSELCGASGNCPPGKALGDPISPPTGYTSNGLTRVTGVQIDASGNVWLANNWLRGDPTTDLFQENPGGYQVVVFLGLAGPVQGPLIGPPQKP